MFHYKDHSLKLFNVSFYLPDNMLLSITEGNIIPDGVVLISVDDSFDIVLQFMRAPMDAGQAMEKSIALFRDNENYQLAKEVCAVTCGDLHGYRADFITRDCLLEEYYFDIPDNKVYNLLTIAVSTRYSIPKEGIPYRNETVSQVLYSLQLS